MINVSIINRSPYELPDYQSEGAAGLDLKAHVESAITLKPFERLLVPTGLYIALPNGYEAQIRSRSGLSIKQGLVCLNSPGTIDSDYRGELKIILANLSTEAQTVNPGDRIAQMIIARYEHIVWNLVETLDKTHRNTSGFGSTGL